MKDASETSLEVFHHVLYFVNLYPKHVAQILILFNSYNMDLESHLLQFFFMSMHDELKRDHCKVLQKCSNYILFLIPEGN